MRFRDHGGWRGAPGQAGQAGEPATPGVLRGGFDSPTGVAARLNGREDLPELAGITWRPEPPHLAGDLKTLCLSPETCGSTSRAAAPPRPLDA